MNKPSNNESSTMSDIGELIKESDQLLKELGWDVAQARDHLNDLCNKKSRHLLDANEWAEYIQSLKANVACLKAFPSYHEKELLTILEAEYSRLGWDKKKQIVELIHHYQGKCCSAKSLTPDGLRAWINHLHSLPVEGNANKKGDLTDHPTKKFKKP